MCVQLRVRRLMFELVCLFGVERPQHHTAHGESITAIAIAQLAARAPA
jgi:hypothetical protein